MGADWTCCRTEAGCSKLTGNRQASKHRRTLLRGCQVPRHHGPHRNPRTMLLRMAGGAYAHATWGLSASIVADGLDNWAPRCSNSSAVSGIRGDSGVRAATDTAAAAICTATGLRSPAAAAAAGASGAAAAAAFAAANPSATALCRVHGVHVVCGVSATTGNQSTAIAQACRFELGCIRGLHYEIGVGRFAIASAIHQQGAVGGPTAGCACL